MLLGAAAGAAGLEAAASVFIAVMGPLPAILAYEDVAAVPWGNDNWEE